MLQRQECGYKKAQQMEGLRSPFLSILNYETYKKCRERLIGYLFIHMLVDGGRYCKGV